MLRSNIKFFSRILKRRVDSSTNFVSFFSFMKYYSSVLFLAQTIYTLLKRSPLKWKFLNFVSHFSFIKDNSSILFLAFLTIYTLLKRSPLKWKFWRVTSAQVKICILSPFETTSPFSKFCMRLQFHERLFLYTILARTFYTLLKRGPLKWKFLRLSSARVKYSQIPYANFETSRFLYKFYIPLQFHER